MAPVSTYTATAHREGDWWVIDVEDVGVTQAKRLDQVEHMARDLVAAMRDVEMDDVAVEVLFKVDPELDGLIVATKSAVEQAREAQAKATEASHTTAVRLKTAGLSLRDIGELTGVSYQRVHQLLAGVGKTAAAVSAAKSAGSGARGAKVRRSAKSGTYVRTAELANAKKVDDRAHEDA